MNKSFKTALKYMLLWVGVFFTTLLLILIYASSPVYSQEPETINNYLNELDSESRLGDGLEVLLDFKKIKCSPIDSGFVIRQSGLHLWGMRCRSSVSYNFYIMDEGIGMDDVVITCEGLNKKDLQSCFEEE